jgi:hypothetical protein
MGRLEQPRRVSRFECALLLRSACRRSALPLGGWRITGLAYALSLYFVFYNFVRTHKAHSYRQQWPLALPTSFGRWMILLLSLMPAHRRLASEGRTKSRRGSHPCCLRMGAAKPRTLRPRHGTLHFGEVDEAKGQNEVNGCVHPANCCYLSAYGRPCSDDDSKDVKQAAPVEDALQFGRHH